MDVFNGRPEDIEGMAHGDGVRGSLLKSRDIRWSQSLI